MLRFIWLGKGYQIMDQRLAQKILTEAERFCGLWVRAGARKLLRRVAPGNMAQLLLKNLGKIPRPNPSTHFLAQRLSFILSERKLRNATARNLSGPDYFLSTGPARNRPRLFHL